mmetsp:Transcript_22262/g.41002  ORF Transcript_22262/g.41002 Transcript_22262/m.41002 type:complete len:218 (-) Transcript_22262:310-963(-)
MPKPLPSARSGLLSTWSISLWALHQGQVAHRGSQRVLLNTLLNDLLLGTQLRFHVVITLQQAFEFSLPCLLLLFPSGLNSLQQAAHLQLLFMQELFLQRSNFCLTLSFPRSKLFLFKPICMLLCLACLRILLLLGQGLLNLSKVEEVSTPSGRARLNLLTLLLHIHCMFLPMSGGERVLQVRGMHLEVRDLSIPDLIELLQLLHVRFFHTKSLCELL